MSEDSNIDLDVRIAEIVFEYPNVCSSCGQHGKVGSDQKFPIMRYSGYESSAFLVVEEMQRRGYHYCVRSAISTEGPVHEAQFDNMAGRSVCAQDAGSAARAICLAALKALCDDVR